MSNDAHAALTPEALRRLLDVAQQLSASADLRQILSVIIDAMRDLLAAERATVFEYDGVHDELFSSVAHGADADSALQIRVPLGEGLAGEAARSRALINVPDVTRDDRFNQDIDRRTGFKTRSVLAIPLIGDDGELVGVAQVLNKIGGAFDAMDEAVGNLLSTQAAVALRRGRLIEDRLMRQKLERDLDLARQIQMSVHPKSLPEIKGFDLAAWSEPAEKAGGDIYDIVGVPNNPDRAVLLVADAAGHGIGPALSVMQVRSMLRIALRLDAGLAPIIAHLNRQLSEDLPTGHFVTAWFAEISGKRGKVASFSAGQGPILWLHAKDGSCEEVEVDEPPLGVLPNLEPKLVNILNMKPGDVLTVISDGVFEARTDEGALYGTERVIDVIRTHRDRSANEILAALRAAVEAFRGDRPAEDDTTIMIVKRKG